MHANGKINQPSQGHDYVRSHDIDFILILINRHILISAPECQQFTLPSKSLASLLLAGQLVVIPLLK